MKKMSFFWILALVICSVISCSEKEQFEQELQTLNREQFKEKLSHEVTQTEARESLEKILTKLNIPSTRGGLHNGYFLSGVFDTNNPYTGETRANNNYVNVDINIRK